VPSLIDRATGKVVQVADEQAAQAVQSGKFGFQAGTRVPVVQQDGTIGTVASKDAAKALAQGLTLATQDQFKGAQFAAKYEGSPVAAAFQTAATAGQGGLRSLTAGASDAAQIGLARALGGDVDANLVREGLRDQKAAHPWAEAAGEVGGFLLPMALTGGASAIGAVPKGIMGAGRAVEGGVARMLGGGALARVGGAAAGAGTEAALMGIGHDISDAALENKPLTAEAMLAHGALNFATGAAIGGALKGGGEGLSAALKAGTSAAGKATGAAADKGAGLYAKAASMMSGGEIATIEELGIHNRSAAAKEARRLAVYDAPKVRADASRSVRENLDDLLEANGRISEETKGALKRGYVEKAVKAGNEADTIASAQVALGETRDEINKLGWDAIRAKKSGELTSLRKYADDAVQWLDDAESKLMNGENVDRFMLLDETKRAFGKWTKALQPVERSADPYMVQVGREMRQSFEGAYERFRQNLQNESLWGKAAVNQAEINANWTKQIEAEQIFKQRLTTEFGRDELNPWRTKQVVDAAKADAYIGGLTNPNNDLVHRAVKGYVEGTKGYARAVAEAYDLPASKLAEVQRVANAATKFGETIASTEKTLTLANRLKELRATEGQANGALTAGAVLGGPVGAAIGMAAGAVTRPGQAITQMAALERVLGKVSVFSSAERATSRVTSEITKSVKGFFSSIPHASELGAQAVTQANVAHYMDSVANLNANPAAQAEKFAQSMGDLPKTAPELTQELAATNTRGLAFLASKLPPNRSGDGSLQPLAEKSALTAEQKRKWALYANTVNDPRSALKDLKSGRFTPEQAEAMRVVYPQLYAVVQKAAMEQLAATKQKLPLSKSAALGTILGVPGAAALTPQRLQANQAVYQQPKQGRAPRAARVPSVAKAFQTSSQRLESR